MFELYDEVILIGATDDTYDIPPGTHGYIVERYPDDAYEIEFHNARGGFLAVSTVSGTNLVSATKRIQRLPRKKPVGGAAKGTAAHS